MQLVFLLLFCTFPPPPLFVLLFYLVSFLSVLPHFHSLFLFFFFGGGGGLFFLLFFLFFFTFFGGGGVFFSFLFFSFLFHFPPLSSRQWGRGQKINIRQNWTHAHPCNSLTNHPYSPICDYKAHTIQVQNMWATYSMFWTKHANQLTPFPHAADAWQWMIFIFTLGTLLCITTVESTICNNANLTRHPMSSVCPTCQVRLNISNQWIYTAVS